jgi:hypothetical protein
MAYSEAAVVNVVHNTLTAHEDIFNGTPTTDIVNMDGWTEALFIIEKSAGGTGTAVITVESCDDVTPTTATAVAFDYQSCTSGNTWSSRAAATSSGFTTTAGANQAYKIWIRADELSGTDKFVRLKATESANDPVDGAIVTVLLGPKYPQDPPAAAIS